MSIRSFPGCGLRCGIGPFDPPNVTSIDVCIAYHDLTNDTWAMVLIEAIQQAGQVYAVQLIEDQRVVFE